MMLLNKMLNKLKAVSHFKLFLILFSVCFVVSSVEGQTKQKKNSGSKEVCKIATTVFRCPDDFVKDQVINDDTILFKNNYEGSITYFYISLPKGEFDDGKLKKIIGDKFADDKSQVFRWKEVEEPLVMTLETNYEKKITSSLGFDNNKLLNFVSRHFVFKNQPIVLGYGYKTETEGSAAKIFFESGSAIGDNAVGCNAIATTLNSITREKKDVLQYCYLSAFKAS